MGRSALHVPGDCATDRDWRDFQPAERVALGPLIIHWSVTNLFAHPHYSIKLAVASMQIFTCHLYLGRTCEGQLYLAQYMGFNLGHVFGYLGQFSRHNPTINFRLYCLIF